MFKALIAFLLVLLGGVPVRAHLIELSSLELTLGDRVLKGTLNLPGPSLSSILPESAKADDINAVTSYLCTQAAEMIIIELDGKRAELKTVTAEANIDVVEVRLLFDAPADPRKLEVEDKFMERAGGEQMLVVFDQQGYRIADTYLTREQRRISIDLTKRIEGPQATDDSAFPLPEAAASPGANAGPPAAPATPAGKRPSFFLLGVEHILTGYDHLLFLFGLLLVCERFVTAAKIISLFTVAHTITLALAALNIVHLSSRIVEPAIAASIAYVGVENILMGREAKGRGLITFCFGLVHGLGFASALRDIGLGRNGESVIGPLFQFNIGVEAGQLAVASIILPLLFAARKKPALMKRLVPVCSALVALAGGFWLVQRVLF